MEIIDKTQKVFDNELKNYIDILKTDGISKIQITQNEKLSLGLLQGYLIFQIYLNSTKSFTIQISISNSMNSKRRLLFSKCSKEFEINNYHCRFPFINFSTNS